jgi:diaminohydroxyphosphoribosylaminopyrimidine deaminase/5-amino-6-(5-phosphoribosylamino)uracil reductase
VEPLTREPAGAARPVPAPLNGSACGEVVEPVDCEAMWAFCLTIAARRRHGQPPSASQPLTDAAGESSPAGALLCSSAAAGRGVGWHPQQGWTPFGDWSGAALAMLDLYRPLLDVVPGQRYLVGHLGQSIDGRIATSSGDSFFINGPQNLIHIHRLRALCDAVLVGAATVASDNPQLTTRLVPGPHATRVVLDPSRRLTPQHRVCADGRCPTLLARLAPEPPCGQAEIVAAVATEAGIDLPALLDQLGQRGLHCILVEGGGITVSRFLAQRLLQRLQIAIAPVIIGSGRQGLQLPEVLALSECLRPSCRQHQMGPDILWDLDLHAGVAGAI